MDDFIVEKVFDDKHLNKVYFNLVKAQQTLSLFEIANYVNEALLELNKLRS